MFFIPYIIFQPPSIILVRGIGPRLHLAGITMLWGATMIGMGFVESFKALAGLRAILGLLEAGFFPSCVYLLSTWYTRCKCLDSFQTRSPPSLAIPGRDLLIKMTLDEVGKRYSLFYLLGCVASAFSGILAYGVRNPSCIHL